MIQKKRNTIKFIIRVSCSSYAWPEEIMEKKLQSKMQSFYNCLHFYAALMKPPFQPAVRLSRGICPHKQILNSTPDLQEGTMQCFQHLLDEFHLPLAVGNYLLRSKR